LIIDSEFSHKRAWLEPFYLDSGPDS